MAENSTNSFLSSGAPGSKITDLLTFLIQEYQQPISGDTVMFVDFARSYLTLHRPAELLTIPDNVGIKLTNFKEFQVFPERLGASYGDGSMANPDSSVSINRQ